RDVSPLHLSVYFFFFHDASTTATYTLSLHDALPIYLLYDHIAGFARDCAGWRPESEEDLLSYCYQVAGAVGCLMAVVMGVSPHRSEEHTSELQSRENLVCRLLLEKKKKIKM